MTRIFPIQLKHHRPQHMHDKHLVGSCLVIYVYAYVYAFICIYIHIHIHTYIYIYIDMHVHICMCIHIYTPHRTVQHRVPARRR